MNPLTKGSTRGLPQLISASDSFDPNHGKIQTFHNVLRSIGHNDDDFEACVAMRDELLEQYAGLEWLFASIGEVVSAEYQKRKHQRRSGSAK